MAADAATENAPPTGEVSCSPCAEAFASAEELRCHCKSERHVYNTKRRLAGLKPIGQEAWERKLRESREAGANKGTAHLKAGKASRKASMDDGADAGSPDPAGEVAALTPEEATFSPLRSLFDRRTFRTVEDCLRYMWKKYNFCIPDREYCTNVEGILSFVWHKINETPHACIFCNRKFPDAASVRRHMLDKNHSRIGTEAKTRRGNPDERGSAELEMEIEEFYDFTASTREITDRIQNPAQKVASILRFFDEDRDGFLRLDELGVLWEATSGSELSEALYQGACQKAGADPNQGLDTDALANLYSQGLADLDAHWVVLQDSLAKRLSARKRARDEEAAKQEPIPEGDEDEDDDDEEDEEDEEDGEDDDSETEILECDDDEEFDEVMRVLGLEKATILDNGDLRLPNGSVACHRDVAYIWRQRGQRLTPEQQLAVRTSGRLGSRLPNRALLFGSTVGQYQNAGSMKMAVSRREQAREGKKFIAVLRDQQRWTFKLGITNNLMQTKNRCKIRSVRGDAAGGS